MEGGAARPVYMWVWRSRRQEGVSADSPGRRWANRGPGRAVGDPEPELRTRERASQPVRCAGLLRPLAGPRSAIPFSVSLRRSAPAASQRPAETNGAPERLTWSPLPLLEASNGHLAGTGWAWEALGRQEGVEVPGLGIRVGRRNNQMWEKRRKAEVKGSRAL